MKYKGGEKNRCGGQVFLWHRPSAFYDICCCFKRVQLSCPLESNVSVIEHILTQVLGFFFLLFDLHSVVSVQMACATFIFFPLHFTLWHHKHPFSLASHREHSRTPPDIMHSLVVRLEHATCDWVHLKITHQTRPYMFVLLLCLTTLTSKLITHSLWLFFIMVVHNWHIHKYLQSYKLFDSAIIWNCANCCYLWYKV